MGKDFTIELDYGTDPETTIARLDGRELVQSRAPMSDTCSILLQHGGQPDDFVHFARRGRRVGEHRVHGPKDPAHTNSTEQSVNPVPTRFVRQSEGRRH
jgi:hypothetical protein